MHAGMYGTYDNLRGTLFHVLDWRGSFDNLTPSQAVPFYLTQSATLLFFDSAITRM